MAPERVKKCFLHTYRVKCTPSAVLPARHKYIGVDVKEGDGWKIVQDPVQT